MRNGRSASASAGLHGCGRSSKPSVKHNVKVRGHAVGVSGGTKRNELDRRVGQRKRIAIAAAVKTDDGVIHFMPPPHRHHHTVHALHYANEGSGLIVARGEQGFVMSDGTFADRVTAGADAIAAGQIAALAHPPNLYSEDLW